jgi:cytochrome b561
MSLNHTHDLFGCLVVAVHATAALFHGFFLRDGVLARMLPWTDR